ncbi:MULTISPECIES: hypothetical protein [Halorussus]|uniref:DUF7261 family protein n=1 Tax=Halorussus TaxID=1070314 RepID=UPI000E214F88|nr:MULTISPECIES: hypothetical protein [Halorussus]NHN58345.1 hypothetical protein [Halorussus sp. JP-T4]
MAPVTDAGGRDRGQLVLVGALTLAVSLVAVAVVLNSAIYTENLASRSDDAGVGAAVDVRESVRDGVGGLTDRANENHAGDDYATLYGTRLPTALADWRPMAVRHRAVAGRTFRVTRARGMEGTRIAQDGVAEFTPRTAGADPLGYAAPNWLVAAPVEVRQFRLAEVSASDLTGASAPFDPETASDVFYVEVREATGSNEWQVALYDAGGGVGVMVRDEDQESAVGSCAADGTATVDLTGATVDGRACEPLSFLDEANGPVAVYYVNGDDVAGTYELTVDRAGHRTDDPLKDRVDDANYGLHCEGPTYADGPGSGSPYATAAVYSATVEFRYDSESVTYETDVRAAAGEPGPGATRPVVTHFKVTDPTADDGAFTVDWAVADPNGDLDSLEIELLDTAGTVVASTTQGLSGAEAGPGSATLTDAGAADSTYDVRITVTDAAGNERGATERHDDDGDESGCPP